MAFVTDPVCWMEFDERDAHAQSEWDGETFYFCHPICKRIFDANPTRFIGKKDRKQIQIQKIDFGRDTKPAAKEL